MPRSGKLSRRAINDETHYLLKNGKNKMYIAKLVDDMGSSGDTIELIQCLSSKYHRKYGQCGQYMRALNYEKMKWEKLRVDYQGLEHKYEQIKDERYDLIEEIKKLNDDKERLIAETKLNNEAIHSLVSVNNNLRSLQYIQQPSYISYIPYNPNNQINLQQNS